MSSRFCPFHRDRAELIPVALRLSPRNLVDGGAHRLDRRPRPRVRRYLEPGAPGRRKRASSLSFKDARPLASCASSSVPARTMADSATVATVVSKRSALADRSGVGVVVGVGGGSAGVLLMEDGVGERGSYTRRRRHTTGQRRLKCRTIPPEPLRNRARRTRLKTSWDASCHIFGRRVILITSTTRDSLVRAHGLPDRASSTDKLLGKSGGIPYRDPAPHECVERARKQVDVLARPNVA